MEINVDKEVAINVVAPLSADEVIVEEISIKR